MRRAAVFFAGLLAAIVAADEAAVPAGRAELAGVEARIAEMRGLLAADEAAMEQRRREALTLFADDAERSIRAYQPYRGELPQTVEEFPAWYLRTMKERTGYDPLEPDDAWQHRWRDTRRAEHAIYQRYEALRISLQRLERLRDRLRR